MTNQLEAGVLGAFDQSLLRDRIPSNSALHGEITDFLIDEGRLLDHDHVDEWFELLAEDVIYRMPVRRTVTRAQGEGYDPVMAHFDDDHRSIEARILRLHSESAFSEDPPSRTRRLINNVIVHATATDGEFFVSSYELLLRSRWDALQFDLVSVQRDDVLRRDGTSWKIARRIMYCDQSLLNTPNLGIFI